MIICHLIFHPHPNYLFFTKHLILSPIYLCRHRVERLDHGVKRIEYVADGLNFLKIMTEREHGSATQLSTHKATKSVSYAHMKVYSPRFKSFAQVLTARNEKYSLFMIVMAPSD